MINPLLVCHVLNGLGLFLLSVWAFAAVFCWLLGAEAQEIKEKAVKTKITLLADFIEPPCSVRSLPPWSVYLT